MSNGLIFDFDPSHTPFTIYPTHIDWNIMLWTCELPLFNFPLSPNIRLVPGQKGYWNALRIEFSIQKLTNFRVMNN